MRSENYCDVCGRYESTAPAMPMILDTQEPLADGIYATDILFGSRNDRSPVIVIGNETAKKMREAKLRGVTLHKIEQ